MSNTAQVNLSVGSVQPYGACGIARGKDNPLIHAAASTFVGVLEQPRFKSCRSSPLYAREDAGHDAPHPMSLRHSW